MTSATHDRADVLLLAELEGRSNMLRFSNVNGVHNIVAQLAGSVFLGERIAALIGEVRLHQG
jgi:hypothetical protein